MFFNNNSNNSFDNQNNTSENRSVNYNTNYNTNYNKGMSSGCLVALGVVLCIMFGMFLIFSFFVSLFSSEEETNTAQVEPYVEILTVEGTIQEGNVNSYGMAIGYQHQWTLDEIDRLSKDELNKGIILYINSPGGGVYESYELYTALQRYKETTENPIYVYMAQYAASGGLMAAMAGDEIYANLMTTTGSIGVIMSFLDTSGFLEKLGIEQVNIVSGPNKAIGAAKLTPEQEKILQDTVDEYYNTFVDIVSYSRSLDRNDVITLADGRTYTATQALELNLIDGIADYADFKSDMMSRVEFSDCELIEAGYTDTSFMTVFFSKLGITQLPQTNATELSQVLEIIEKSENSTITFTAK
ncbi:MAG: signal peptide peptidase SppA [Oscillospiraceae bacterium]|nr:signal peptide peptidase SppA [Oscillospiraceae bacterium]